MECSHLETMNINFKKDIVFSSILAATILSACGDNSSSSTNAENDNPSSSSIGNNTQPLPAWFDDAEKVHYNLFVDEDAQTFTISLSEQSNMACVIDGDNVEWMSVPSIFDETYKYDFVGDTLVLYFWNRDDVDFSTDGGMYVGGTAGNLYGSWKYIPCLYDSEKSKSKCSDNSHEAIAIFSDKNVTTAEQNPDDETFDYMSSSFRESLLSALDDGREWVPYIEELTDPAREKKEFASIKESSITKTGETFKYKGTTYTVNVPVYSFPDFAYNRTITIEIASAEKKCTGSLNISFKISKELCTNENRSNFSTAIFEDANGNTFRYAKRYEKDNNGEFRRCLGELFGFEDIDSLFD